MRSDLVFSATLNTPNRFLLCRMLSMSAQHLLRRPGSFPEGINSCLVMAGNNELGPATAMTLAPSVRPTAMGDLIGAL